MKNWKKLSQPPVHPININWAGPYAVYPFPDLSTGGTAINKPQSLHESSNLLQIHMQQMTKLVTVREAGGGPRDTKEEESAGMGGWKTMEDHGRPQKAMEDHGGHLEWAVIEQRFEIWKTRLTGFHERN